MEKYFFIGDKANATDANVRKIIAHAGYDANACKYFPPKPVGNNEFEVTVECRQKMSVAKLQKSADELGIKVKVTGGADTDDAATQAP